MTMNNENTNVNVETAATVEDIAYVVYLGMVMTYKEFKELKEAEKN